MAKAPTVCAKGAPLYNYLLEAGNIWMVTASSVFSPPAFLSSPPLFSNVQDYCYKALVPYLVPKKIRTSPQAG